jgi:hypothetical protein
VIIIGIKFVRIFKTPHFLGVVEVVTNITACITISLFSSDSRHYKRKLRNTITVTEYNVHRYNILAFLKMTVFWVVALCSAFLRRLLPSSSWQ